MVAASATAQQLTVDPFPTPIETTQGVVAVKFVEFATIPDVKGEAPRLMHFVDEPGTKRLFVSVMTGALYSLSYDGKVVTSTSTSPRPPGTWRCRRPERSRAFRALRSTRSSISVARRGTGSSTPIPIRRTPRRSRIS